MAFGDTIRTYKANIASGEASVTISFTPVSGNLLVFGVGRSSSHGAGGAWSTGGAPSGWTAIHDSGINTGNLGAAWWWKISDGTETSVATSGTNAAGTTQPVVIEIEGPFAASPFDVAAEDVTNLSSIVTSQSTGTTGTTAQNDELAIAFFAGDRFDTLDGSRAYTNSFTEVVIGDGASARGTSILAKKVLSATGAVTCTFSCTDTGDEMYGSVATFKKSASGHTVAVNQNNETDTAQTVSKIKNKAIGQNSETDTPQAIIKVKQLAIAQNVETDSAQAIARIKQKAIGLNSETDVAQTILSIKQITLAQATETDVLQSVTAQKIKVISQANEIDLAQPISTNSAILISQVEETDLAQALFPLKRVAIAQVEETETLQSITPSKIKALGQATETDFAQAISQEGIITAILGQVVEVDSVFHIARSYTGYIGDLTLYPRNVDLSLHVRSTEFTLSNRSQALSLQELE